MSPVSTPMDANTPPPDFDPFTQLFPLYHANGTQFLASMEEINLFRQYSVRLGINYGSQIGASFIFFLILILLTKREKRNSFVFALNGFCILLNGIRMVVSCLYLTSQWANPYAMVSENWSRVTDHDRANTIAANVLALLLVIAVMLSLSSQVWIVCVTAKPVVRNAVMGVTTALAFVAVVLRFIIMVLSNVRTMHDEDLHGYFGLRSVAEIMQAIAIWVYSCVFTFKLGHAMLRRHRLGMPQLGPMQIIFIMGCQTMIIPAIFTVLQFLPAVPELGSVSLTLTCIFLPLSAMWAGTVANDSHLASRGHDSHLRLFSHYFKDKHSSDSTSSIDLDTVAFGSEGNDNNKRGGSVSTAYSYASADPRNTEFLANNGGASVQHDWAVGAGRV